MFEDRFGNIKKSFKVFIDGTWDGQFLVLKEDFIYDDGSKDYREWKIEKDKNNPNAYSDMQKELLELQVVLLVEMHLIGNMLLNFK